MENITRDNGNLAECCTAANGLQSSSSGALVLLDDHSEGQVLGVDLELVLVEGHVNGVALGQGVAPSLLNVLSSNCVHVSVIHFESTSLNLILRRLAFN